MSNPLSATALPLLLIASLASCAGNGGETARAITSSEKTPMTATADPTPPTVKTEKATFGGGCFWCVEAVLEQLDGVLDVTSGYAGGAVENPTYQQVCSGSTGHAEVVQVTFDPTRIELATLLEWFFKSHDPTTLNRQGPDEGTQYRSVIFFHSETQKTTALAAIQKARAKFRDPIVTELRPLSKFWPAEPYHQDYFRNNPTKAYCSRMIAPKLQKLGLPAAKK